MQKQYSKIKLVLTRHGETQQNSTHTLCGQMPGKLTQKGKQQAQKIGDYFHKEKFYFDYIYVSDLQRTKDTFSNIVKKAPHLQKQPIKYMDVLRQKHGGILQGKSLKSWKQGADRQKKSIRAYKCKNAESWQDVNKRCYKFMELLVKQHLMIKQNIKKLQNQQIKQVQKMIQKININQNQNSLKKQQEPLLTILAVSHGGYIMQFHNLYRVQTLKQKAVFDNSAKNCSIHQFLIEYPKYFKQYKLQEVKVKCIRQNFTGHL